MYSALSSNGAASRSASPDAITSGPMEILTPRSKVKAMLAPLDSDSSDSSDKENRDGPSKASPQPKERVSSPRQPAKFTTGDQVDKAEKRSVRVDSDMVSDHMHDIVVPKPRKGTMASRMQTNAQAESSESEEEPRGGGNAYERVKRAMLAGKARKQASSVAEDAEAEASDGSDSQADREQKNETVALIQRGQRTRDGSLSRTGSGDLEADHTFPPSSNRRSPPPSPGLFVSPDKALQNGHDSSRSPLAASPAPANGSSRFQALLARKRKEMNKARGRDSSEDITEENEELGGLEPKSKQKKPRRTVIRAESETDEDRDVGKKLTQQARPTRKASKKALEEMNRETQRMSRNMQLTHEARTKTKFKKEDFLAKFNFRRPAAPMADELRPSHAASSSSSPKTPRDHEASQGTPPSSPPSLGEASEKPAKLRDQTFITNDIDAASKNGDDTDHEPLPDIDTLLSEAASAPQTAQPSEADGEHCDNKGKRYSARRFAKSAKQLPAKPIADDDDDDLEIVMPKKPSRLPIFDSLPTAKVHESHSIHALRALAHLNYTTNSRKRSQPSMGPAELQTLLQRRAREQAKADRAEKIQRLKDKGVVVQSAEERERDQMQLENMLEKARQEAEDIAKREKEAAKKEGGVNGDGLPDSDDEDADYEESVNDGDGVPLSGSEDEEDAASDVEPQSGEEANSETEGEHEDGVEASDEEDAGAGNFMLDNEAAEDSADDERSEAEEESNEEVDAEEVQHNEIDTKRVVRRPKRLVVLDDDDEDVNEDKEDGNGEKGPHQDLALIAPETPKKAPVDAFGFARTNPAPIGLSQVFGGTMAESQTQMDEPMDDDSQQDSMTFLRGLPPPDLPDFTSPQATKSQEMVLQDSQVDQTPNPSNNSRLGMVNFDTQMQTPGAETTFSELPDPSQDVGFQIIDSQASLMVPSFSTIETLPLIGPTDDDTLPQKRKGRLVRRRDSIEATYPEEDPLADESGDEEDGGGLTNAFDVMRRVKNRSLTPEFDKKTSKAKGMVQEQAEESEDEYAGLGGASDDESGEELDEDTKQMIDDEGNVRTDERDIAAYYAERERHEDEKGVEKLYKDIVQGGLRRKRGAQDDLWESDDEDERAARRRAAKQREFAKMRKALLADEKLGKIAENPKQQAFLQAIEDRGDTFELDLFARYEEETSQITDSQGDGDYGGQPRPLSTLSANLNKRKHTEFEDDIVPASQEENRTTPNMRRSTKTTKSTSLAGIRNTLSEIIGEPDSMLESHRLGSESPSNSSDEGEEDNGDWGQEEGSDQDDLYSSTKQMPPPAPPATQPNRRRAAASGARSRVINRIALKREASASSNTAAHASSRLAFHASAKTALSGFRPPSLLRRATTNSSSMSGASASTTASASDAAGGFGGKESVKMGGSTKSSISYLARERERRARVEVVEKERRQGREKIGKMRRSAAARGGIGALLGGSFE